MNDWHVVMDDVGITKLYVRLIMNEDEGLTNCSG